ncbi:MAG TPA: STAS domain-containing protein [Chondromyces sp.]|nr:STAS domain-containing protein [Chondromyces sp.]
MKAIGQLPESISLLHALDSIGENILISDSNYNIVWMNSYAADLLSVVAPLYGFSSAEELIGINMDRFHKNPAYQINIMDSLSESHRARINILDQFVTDIVVTPIKNGEDEITGYVVMLMDVTTKAEEEKQKEKLLSALSVPILRIWERAIALPLIGEFDSERGDRLISSVLEECTIRNVEYVLIDLSGLFDFSTETGFYIQKLCDCVRLIGAECIIVGISPKIAMSMAGLKNNSPTFSTAQSGLEYILSEQKKPT